MEKRRYFGMDEDYLEAAKASRRNPTPKAELERETIKTKLVWDEETLQLKEVEVRRRW